MSLYLRQGWRDPRLCFSGTSIRAYFWDDIWVPDTVVRYKRSSSMHRVPVDNKLLMIASTGDVWYVLK